MSKTYISTALRQQVTADFSNRCAYCHSPEMLLDHSYEIDHIIPEAAGGLTELENLCFACPVCNPRKSVKQTGVDPVTNRRVILFHPRRQNWGRHFQWSTDGKTIEGRTVCGRATVSALQLNSASLVRMRGYWLRLGGRPPQWELRPE